MPRTVFFSWQSDTSSAIGRDFIEQALTSALAAINAGATVEPALRSDLLLDRDTKDIGGQPPIVDTIFKKIDNAMIFVSDITLVAKRVDPSRMSPNPNVLIEYGWALKTVGYPCIIAVMNVAYGEPTDASMPFDVKHLRYPITYHLAPDATESEIQNERIKLTRTLEHELRVILGSPEFKKIQDERAQRIQFKTIEPDISVSRFRRNVVPLGIFHQRALLDPPRDMFLYDGPAVWLRVMPLFATSTSISLRTLDDLYDAHTQLFIPLAPFGTEEGHWLLRADDGFGCYTVYRDRSPLTYAVTFVFFTGEIWSINTDWLIGDPRREKLEIPFLEKPYTTALARFIELLKKVRMPGPYRWIAGMEGLRGRGIESHKKPSHWSYEQPIGLCVSNVVSAEGVAEESIPCGEALVPFFELLFERCGLERDWYLGLRQKAREERYKLAGAEFKKVSDGFRVVNVKPSSSADAAGLKKDDLVTEIDDTAATTISLRDLINRIGSDERYNFVNLRISTPGAKERRVVLRDLN